VGQRKIIRSSVGPNLRAPQQADHLAEVGCTQVCADECGRGCCRTGIKLRAGDDVHSQSCAVAHLGCDGLRGVAVNDGFNVQVRQVHEVEVLHNRGLDGFGGDCQARSQCALRAARGDAGRGCGERDVRVYPALSLPGSDSIMLGDAIAASSCGCSLVSEDSPGLGGTIQVLSHSTEPYAVVTQYPPA